MLECGCEGTCVLAEQVAWSPDRVAEHLATPVPFTLDEAETDGLELGLKAPHVWWQWKPYAVRSAEHRADFDRLIVSIYHEGVRAPLVVWDRHVLIGQRRAEIARRLGIRRVPVLVIGEDVRRWWQYDLDRVRRHITPEVGQHAY